MSWIASNWIRIVLVEGADRATLCVRCRTSSTLDQAKVQTSTGRNTGWPRMSDAGTIWYNVTRWMVEESGRRRLLQTDREISPRDCRLCACGRG
jgi:hypothetical protein